jgi:hypothetical protein
MLLEFIIVEAPQHGWNAVPPAAISLESMLQGGTRTTATVQLEVFGGKSDATIQMSIVARSTKDATASAECGVLNFLVRGDSGFPGVPGPSLPIVVFGLLMTAAAGRNLRHP